MSEGMIRTTSAESSAAADAPQAAISDHSVAQRDSARSDIGTADPGLSTVSGAAIPDGASQDQAPKSFLGIPAFLPWWWMLVLGGGLGLGAAQLLWARFVPSPFLTDSLTIQIVGVVGFLIFAVLWIALVVLTFVIAPVLSAKDRNPVFRVPPAWHLNTLQWIVTAPAFIIAIVGIYDTFERSIDHFISSGDLVLFRIPDWAWIYIPIFLGAVIYAWLMHPWLRRRLVDSTRWRGVCFDCGYDLRSQAEIMLAEEMQSAMTRSDSDTTPTPMPASASEDLNVRCSECGETNPVPRAIVSLDVEDETSSEEDEVNSSAPVPSMPA